MACVYFTANASTVIFIFNTWRWHGKFPSVAKGLPRIIMEHLPA
jgi:hypothetical protein